MISVQLYDCIKATIKCRIFLVGIHTNDSLSKLLLSLCSMRRAVEATFDPPCGECSGGVTDLQFKNIGDEAKIKVKDGSGTLFEGVLLTNNETGLIEGSKDDFKFDGDVKIYRDTVLVSNVHTSCSQPIGVGMQFGDLEVVAGHSIAGGDFCEADCEAVQLSFTVQDDQVKMLILNDGIAPLQISSIFAEWPNGKGNLKQIDLNGKIWEDKPVPAGTTIDSDWLSDTNRALKSGDDQELRLVFTGKEKNGEHFLLVNFTNGCTLEEMAM
jgi:hypothetical protein